ncbi:hypothetical protein DIPPA_21785 [Diplonema papillatum]|nr:hypothetical protein DIPPA_21785 [Diplonema papillatum]
MAQLGWGGKVLCSGCAQLCTTQHQCPKCAEGGLQGGYFCSQACFAMAWKSHRATHSARQQAKVKAEAEGPRPPQRVMCSVCSQWCTIPPLPYELSIDTLVEATCAACSKQTRPPSVYTEMASPSHRLASFESWPYAFQYATPARLCSAGYFYQPTLESPDRCVCYRCKGDVRNWSESSIPWLLHKKFRKDCPLVKEAFGGSFHPGDWRCRNRQCQYVNKQETATCFMCFRPKDDQLRSDKAKPQASAQRADEGAALRSRLRPVPSAEQPGQEDHLPARLVSGSGSNHISGEARSDGGSTTPLSSVPPSRNRREKRQRTSHSRTTRIYQSSSTTTETTTSELGSLTPSERLAPCPAPTGVLSVSCSPEADANSNSEQPPQDPQDQPWAVAAGSSAVLGGGEGARKKCATPPAAAEAAHGCCWCCRAHGTEAHDCGGAAAAGGKGGRPEEALCKRCRLRRALGLVDMLPKSSGGDATRPARAPASLSLLSPSLDRESGQKEPAAGELAANGLKPRGENLVFLDFADEYGRFVSALGLALDVPLSAQLDTIKDAMRTRSELLLSFNSMHLNLSLTPEQMDLRDGYLIVVQVCDDMLLSVQDDAGETVLFCVNKDVPVRHMLDHYCNGKRVDRGTLVFLHQNAAFDDSKTPCQLGLAGNTTIRVARQPGGGGSLPVEGGLKDVPDGVGEHSPCAVVAAAGSLQTLAEVYRLKERVGAEELREGTVEQELGGVSGLAGLEPIEREPEGSARASEREAASGVVLLTLVAQDGYRAQGSTAAGKPLKDLLEKFCDRNKSDRTVIKAYHRGQSVDTSATCAELAIKTGDILEVVTEERPQHTITLALVDPDCEEDRFSLLHFVVDADAPLRSLAAAYCKKQGYNPARTCFLHNGSTVDQAKTPTELGLEEGSILDVTLHSPGHLSISVFDPEGEGVCFSMKRSTPLKRLTDAYCRKKNIEPKSARFLFDGVTLDETQTPDQLHMDNFEIIDVLDRNLPEDSCHWLLLPKASCVLNVLDENRAASISALERIEQLKHRVTLLGIWPSGEYVNKPQMALSRQKREVRFLQPVTGRVVQILLQLPKPEDVYLPQIRVEARHEEDVTDAFRTLAAIFADGASTSEAVEVSPFDERFRSLVFEEGRFMVSPVNMLQAVGFTISTDGSYVLRNKTEEERAYCKDFETALRDELRFLTQAEALQASANGKDTGDNDPSPDHPHNAGSTKRRKKRRRNRGSGSKAQQKVKSDTLQVPLAYPWEQGALKSKLACYAPIVLGEVGALKDALEDHPPSTEMLHKCKHVWSWAASYWYFEHFSILKSSHCELATQIFDAATQLLCAVYDFLYATVPESAAAPLHNQQQPAEGGGTPATPRAFTLSPLPPPPFSTAAAPAAPVTSPGYPGALYNPTAIAPNIPRPGHIPAAKRQPQQQPNSAAPPPYPCSLYTSGRAQGNTRRQGEPVNTVCYPASVYDGNPQRFIPANGGDESCSDRVDSLPAAYPSCLYRRRGHGEGIQPAAHVDPCDAQSASIGRVSVESEERDEGEDAARLRIRLFELYKAVPQVPGMGSGGGGGGLHGDATPSTSSRQGDSYDGERRPYRLGGKDSWCDTQRDSDGCYEDTDFFRSGASDNGWETVSDSAGGPDHPRDVRLQGGTSCLKFLSGTTIGETDSTSHTLTDESDCDTCSSYQRDAQYPLEPEVDTHTTSAALLTVVGCLSAVAAAGSAVDARRAAPVVAVAGAIAVWLTVQRSCIQGEAAARGAAEEAEKEARDTILRSLRSFERRQQKRAREDRKERSALAEREEKERKQIAELESSTRTTTALRLRAAVKKRQAWELSWAQLQPSECDTRAAVVSSCAKGYERILLDLEAASRKLITSAYNKGQTSLQHRRKAVARHAKVLASETATRERIVTEFAGAAAHCAKQGVLALSGIAAAAVARDEGAARGELAASMRAGEEAIRLAQQLAAELRQQQQQQRQQQQQQEDKLQQLREQEQQQQQQRQQDELKQRREEEQQEQEVLQQQQEQQKKKQQQEELQQQQQASQRQEQKKQAQLKQKQQQPQQQQPQQQQPQQQQQHPDPTPAAEAAATEPGRQPTPPALPSAPAPEAAGSAEGNAAPPPPPPAAHADAIPAPAAPVAEPELLREQAEGPGLFAVEGESPGGGAHPPLAPSIFGLAEGDAAEASLTSTAPCSDRTAPQAPRSAFPDAQFQPGGVHQRSDDILSAHFASPHPPATLDPLNGSSCSALGPQSPASPVGELPCHGTAPPAHPKDGGGVKCAAVPGLAVLGQAAQGSSLSARAQPFFVSMAGEGAAAAAGVQSLFGAPAHLDDAGHAGDAPPHVAPVGPPASAACNPQAEHSEPGLPKLLDIDFERLLDDEHQQHQFEAFQSLMAPRSAEPPRSSTLESEKDWEITRLRLALQAADDKMAQMQNRISSLTQDNQKLQQQCKQLAQGQKQAPSHPHGPARMCTGEDDSEKNSGSSYSSTASSISPGTQHQQMHHHLLHSRLQTPPDLLPHVARLAPMMMFDEAQGCIRAIPETMLMPRLRRPGYCNDALLPSPYE